MVEVEGRPILLFKHAIRTIDLPKTWTLEEQKERREDEQERFVFV